MSDKKASSLKLKLIPIELDKPRHLKYDMNAFAYLEEQFGGIQEALEALQGGKVKAVLEVLKAGLIHEDENITVKQIGGAIGLSQLEAIAIKINDALGLSFPEVDASVKEKNG